MNESFDTVIVGAGAAGLAVASRLAAQGGGSICILEARERIGGRILTLRPPNSTSPIELGAEFVHGRAPATFEVLRRVGIDAMDAAQERWTIQQGELARGDVLFDRMQQQLRRVGPPKTDLSLDAYLAKHRRALSASTRRMACLLAE